MNAETTKLFPIQSPQESQVKGINNRLLLALPRTILDRILRISEPVSLARGQRLYHTDQPLNHLYFINRGLACIFKTMEDGRTVEIEAIGIDDIVDALFLIGSDRAILDTVVQIPGTALRVRREDLMNEIEKDKALRQFMQRYARHVCNRVTRTVACHRLHHLEQRCCHWLLMAHDSALSDEFPLTHEFLAMMLGYQRAGVSIIMRSLVDAGVIAHKRGKVSILDRTRLEAMACECYRTTKSDADELYAAAPKFAQVFEFKQTDKSRAR
jgi:CRP-like cAMP-binding protein